MHLKEKTMIIQIKKERKRWARSRHRREGTTESIE